MLKTLICTKMWAKERSHLDISQKQEFTTRIALSKSKHEYNLVLTRVYKVNYPKQELLNMSYELNTCVWTRLSKIQFCRRFNLNMWVREVLSTVKSNFSTAPSLYIKVIRSWRQRFWSSTTLLKFNSKCNEKQSRYNDVVASANPSRSFHFTYLESNFSKILFWSRQ